MGVRSVLAFPLMNRAFDLGRQRAEAGRRLPTADELRRVWGLGREDRALFVKGYLGVTSNVQ